MTDLIIPGLGLVPIDDVPFEIKKIINKVQGARIISKAKTVKVLEELLADKWKIKLNFDMPPNRCVVHAITNYYSDLNGLHQQKEFYMKVGRLYKDAYDEIVMAHGTEAEKKRIKS